MFEPVQKPFTDVLAEHVSYDPDAGLLGNIGENLNRGIDKVYTRNMWRDRADRMQAAIAQDRERQALAHTKMARLEDQLGAIVEAADYGGWRQVPDLVVALFKQAAPAACRLAAWADRAAGPEDQLWWHGDTRMAWAELADVEKRADWEALPEVPGVPDVALVIEPIPPPPVRGWVLVKAADGYLAPIARPGLAVQHALGGTDPNVNDPHGLASAIVNGLIGGGLGYGAGWIADRFLPEEHVNKGRLPLTMGLAGLGIGAVPGLWRYTAQRRAQGLPPGATGAPPPLPLPAHQPSIWEPSPPSSVPGLEPGPSGSVLDADGTKLAAAHPLLQKAAQGYINNGVLFQPRIDVNGFGQAVWSDVSRPAGQFDPWGQSHQGGTPPYAAAAVTGLLAGTAQAAGTPVVSPWQVASAAAVGAGKGWLTGLAAGKVLGALAGLKPEAQQQLQSVGTWGGLITGVANALYR
jgi:hypothetical protein